MEDLELEEEGRSYEIEKLYAGDGQDPVDGKESEDSLFYGSIIPWMMRLGSARPIWTSLKRFEQ